MFYHLEAGAVYYLDDDRAKHRQSWLTETAEVWVEVEEEANAGYRSPKDPRRPCPACGRCDP
jgi:hypothetical protein